MLEFASTVFECRYTPVRDQDRKPAGFIAVATDVTERFRLQREILEISDREQARIGPGRSRRPVPATDRGGVQRQFAGADARRAAAPGSGTARKISALLDEAITESRRVCRGLYPDPAPHARAGARAGGTGRPPPASGIKVQCRCEAEPPASCIAT